MTSPAKYNKNTFFLAHDAILLSVQNIQSRSRVFPEARKYLPELVGALDVHWGGQSGAFYPALEDFFLADREAAAKIAYFREDLKEVKVSYLSFQEKYITGCPRPLDVRRFPIESSQFFELIRARINAEEEYLLPLLDIYAGQPSSLG
ncbi:MAG: hypothetical protein WC450_07470 [Candidatus Omnitrophota bacterium]|jgi:hypothetical protein